MEERLRFASSGFGGETLHYETGFLWNTHGKILTVYITTG